VFLNLSHYCFFPIHDPKKAGETLAAHLDSSKHRGTFLIAPEGVNFYFCGKEEDILPVLEPWLDEIGCPNRDYKRSLTQEFSFKRMKIKIKKEIVTMGTPDLDVKKLTADHLSASEWKTLLQEKKDLLLIDMRNNFEYEFGTFQDAVPAGTDIFRQWPAKVAEFKEKYGTDKPVAMFCTGGIRCEKASAVMRKEGFKEVYQLDGGILRYFEKEGSTLWKGECFVFDDRRVVNPNLEPALIE